MTLVEEILRMYYTENLTVGDIAGALHQDPKYVWEVIKKKWYGEYEEDRDVDLWIHLG